MKSLSDYAKILRDTASGLNLHGESVEMLVQMLANALYISEVEHITYSQEASLERASQENSKIQHCVNQMYSVYRGANPRVILSIKASKLFQFGMYDEIIKSNNFKVYYLGYYDQDLGEIVYAPSTIYPESDAIILGLISKDIFTSSWTITDRNTFYRNFPESDLSSDLYLKDLSNGVTVDTARIFSDHLTSEKFFDLTLPGYGCRIYYPETYRGGNRESLINTDLEINIYKYLSLSGIAESEKKALKMNGSTLQAMSDETLANLGSREDYPGLIYIPETSRDGLNSIHYRANKSRYTGSYMSTNSDLSFLLNEYYPSKIRTSGVTHRFETPKSTTVEKIHRTFKFSTQDNITPGSLELGGWINKQGYLPAGTLKFKYNNNRATSKDGVVYELMCSSSVIPATKIDKTITPSIPYIKVEVYKNNDGSTEVLSTGKDLSEEGLKITYQFSNHGVQTITTSDEILIPVSGNVLSENGCTLTVSLGSYDTEVIPVVITPVGKTTTTTSEDKTTTTVEETSVGNYYSLDLGNDIMYIQTSQDGVILTTGNTTKATVYHNGQEVTSGVTYSVIPVSDLDISITQGGIITVKGMSPDKLTSKVIILAEYLGVTLRQTLTVKKSISNLSASDKPVNFRVYGDDVIISRLTAGMEINEYTLEIPENTWKKIRIVKDDPSAVSITSGEYSYYYQVYNNVYTGDNVSMVPALYLYYIPYSSSNLLTSSEKEKFISQNKSYYITQDIEIKEGTEYIAKFDINLELYTNSVLDEKVLEILEDYSYKFGVDLEGEDSQIESLITKISEVKRVKDIKISYYNSLGESVDYEKIKETLDISYYKIECNIYSTL